MKKGQFQHWTEEIEISNPPNKKIPSIFISSVILSLLGGYGLKNIYVPLFPYAYTIGVFSSCEIEKKKSLNMDGSVSVKEYLPVNFTLDHRYMDGVLSSKMVKAARELFENPDNFQVKE